MKSLAGSVSRIAAPILGKRGFAEAEMVLQWAAVVGEELARLSAPVKLSFGTPGTKDASARVNGILHLRVAPGTAIEFQHLEPVIVERINTFFGYRAVARLALRQGPLPRRAPPPSQPRTLSPTENHALQGSLDLIADPELRAALERLGRAVIGSSKG
jgi:hypothetical protein